MKGWVDASPPDVLVSRGAADRGRAGQVVSPAVCMLSASFAPTMGGAARQDAVSRFGLDRMVDGYEACYRAVAAGHLVASISGENLSERP